MEKNSLQQKLNSLLNQRIYIETKTHHIGYLFQKGILTHVGIDFIELDNGGKTVLVPLKEIRTVTIK